jgi:3-oxoacyl-[acyl-carrier-protein] synthase II
MDRAEVVITGIGMVSPLGATAAETAQAWRAGRSAGRRKVPELVGTRFESLEVAVLPAFDPAGRLGSRRMLKYMSEAAVLGCVAAHEAALEARLGARFVPDRVGLFAGTGLTAANLEDALPAIKASLDENGRLSCQLLGERGLAAANPLLSFKILPNMPPCLISIIEGIRGPNFVFTPWEGQTGAALVEAWAAVASGEVDCALCGGADHPVHPATAVHLARSGLLQAGEFPAAGAAYLVLERADTAVRDGRRVYAHIARAELVPSEKHAADPLAGRVGRSFAAAPAILLALAATSPDGEVAISGVDHQGFHAELRVWP